ncbi:hypothetical protein WJX77_010479, partial [Trebouxia sp. C0004]
VTQLRCSLTRLAQKLDTSETSLSESVKARWKRAPLRHKSAERIRLAGQTSLNGRTRRKARQAVKDAIHD